MSDAIKGGIYRGVNETKQVSLDRRMTKVKLEDGSYADFPSLDYVRDLEKQILDFRSAVATQEGEIKKLDGAMKRLTAALKKLEGRLR